MFSNLSRFYLYDKTKWKSHGEKLFNPLTWKSDMGYIADTEKVLFLFLRADMIGKTTRDREWKKKMKTEEAVVYWI